MDGFQIFKKKREESGLSVRNFAAVTGISPRSVSYYENGKMSLATLPVFKAVSIYEMLDIVVDEFYDKYYPYKKEIDAKICGWKKENPRELRYVVLKQRIKERLAKMKERKSVPEQRLEQLYGMYYDVFEQAKASQDKDGYISNEFYESVIMVLLYEIKKSIETEHENTIAASISDALIKTEYTAVCVAGFCDITPRHFSDCINGIYDFSKMQIITALKLCYILNLDFNQVFRE